MEAIPDEIASKLCEEIRTKNINRWYSFYGIWCTMCNKVSKGDKAKFCYKGQPDNRGCSQVNKRYANINLR